MRDEQILRLREIASGFENFYCVECAGAIQEYLMAEGIHGKRIKLYTGSAVKPNNYIYDDSVPKEAISENGRPLFTGNWNQRLLFGSEFFNFTMPHFSLYY